MTHLVKLAMEGRFEETPALSLEELEEMEGNAEKSEAEIALDLDEAEKAMSVVGALEDLAFVASDIQEVTPREAALIQIATDATMINTGVDSSAIFPAMEDINDGKSIAARIKEVIKRIVAAVRELLTKISKAIKDYRNTSLQLAIQRKKQITTLLSRYKRIDFSSKNKSDIECTPLFTVDNDGSPKTLTSVNGILDALKGMSFVNKNYANSVSFQINDTSLRLEKFYKAVLTSDKDTLKKMTNALGDEKNFEWMKNLPGTFAADGGFDTSNLPMGLRLHGAVDSDPVANGMSSLTDDSEIASAFSKVMSSMMLQASVQSTSVEKDKISTPSARDIRDMLVLADTLLDACLDKPNTLMRAMLETTERVEKAVTAINNIALAIGDLNNKEAAHFSPYLSTIESVTRMVSTMPHRAFSAVIAANIRTATRVADIAHKSMLAYGRVSE